MKGHVSDKISLFSSESTYGRQQRWELPSCGIYHISLILGGIDARQVFAILRLKKEATKNMNRSPAEPVDHKLLTKFAFLILVPFSPGPKSAEFE